MSKVIKKDNILPNTLINLEVDNIIENNAQYIVKRNSLVKQYNTIKRSNISNKEELLDKINNTKSELYYKYRGEADTISDNILNFALLNKYNIAWETTGRTIAWTMKEIKRIQRQDYKVILVYPLVPSEELIKRAKQRRYFYCTKH